jgi:hypothetical protein
LPMDSTGSPSHLGFKSRTGPSRNQTHAGGRCGIANDSISPMLTSYTLQS